MAIPGAPSASIFPASNAGRILTDGVDFGFNYRRDLGFARLNLSFNGNWTNRSQFEAIVPGSIIPPGFPGAGQPFTPIPVRECVGLYGPNCGSPGQIVGRRTIEIGRAPGRTRPRLRVGTTWMTGAPS